MKFDIIVPVKTSLVDFFCRYTIVHLRKIFPDNRIFVVSNIINFDKIKHKSVRFIDEDKLISGLTFKNVSSYLLERGAEVNRAGWYFQQFIKLGLSKLDYISDDYLIWDADCLILNKMEFNSNKTIFAISDEYNKPYFDTIETIWGIQRQVDFSFISEHMMFKKFIVNEMLGHISKNNEWWRLILDSIDIINLNNSGFSEYESYGNYLTSKKIVPFSYYEYKTIRYAKSIVGLNPNKLDLFILGLFFDYVSFEERDKMPKNYIYKYLKFIKYIYHNFYLKA